MANKKKLKLVFLHFLAFPRLELLEFMHIYQLRDYGLILCFLLHVFCSLLMNIMQMLFLLAM